MFKTRVLQTRNPGELAHERDKDNLAKTESGGRI